MGRPKGSKQKPTVFRAGRRKCERCKVVWNRPKGSGSRICDRCVMRCPRCDSPRPFACTGYCDSCNAEITKMNNKKNDPTGERARDYKLVRNYGITVNEYEAILAIQGGGCWICGKVPSKGQNRLSVDHLHSKGEKKRNPREKRGRVRGILCWPCNAALGKFGDNITKLKKAAEYLEVWPAQSVLKEKCYG